MSELVQKYDADTPEARRLDIHIHFGFHGNSLDMQEADRLAKSPAYDLYAPELPYVSEPEQVVYRKLAKGDMKAYELIRRNVASLPVAKAGELALYRAIFACRKPIIFADATNEDMNDFNIAPQNIGPWNTSTYEGFVDSIAEIIDNETDNCIKRDDIIASRLPTMAIELALGIPKLKSKPEIRTLVTIGSRHTGLYHLLESQGYNISRSFSKKPFIYPPIEEAIRQKRFKGYVDLDVMLRAAWSQILSQVAAPTKDNFDIYDWQFISEVQQSAARAVDDSAARELFSLRATNGLHYVQLAGEIMLGATTDPGKLLPYLIANGFQET